MMDKAVFEMPPHDLPASGKTGVLIVALGTPSAPTTQAVRRYLREFLSDKRVVEMSRLLWLPILYGPILTFRSPRSAKAYAKIWGPKTGQSPLRDITQAQAEGLSARFEKDGLLLDWAFRYGQPSIAQAYARLRAQGAERILLFPLYPHYSATTTASVQDAFFDLLKQERYQPALRTVPAYYDHPVFIAALRDQITESLSGLDFEPEHILASYHSIPEAYWHKGDPYPCHCFKTSRLLGEALNQVKAKNAPAATSLSEPENREKPGSDRQDYLLTSFQSRVGRARWVGPYTDERVIELAAKGVKRLAVVAPAFSADCLETLEELNIALRASFLKAGGTHFAYIPCLNASPRGLDLLETLIRTELGGWL